jgi:hypothetical protein
MEDNYILLHPTQPNSGMFAFIWQTIRGMFHYPNYKYYIFFGYESCYYDIIYSRNYNIYNVWDYYFEQPFTKELPPSYKIIKEVGLIFDEISEFRDIYIKKHEYDERRIYYNDIINNYVKLLPHIQLKIDDFAKNNFSNKKVIGIHCRGTDHPEKMDILQSLELSKPYAEMYDLIFLTSDQQEYIDVFKNYFGSRLITYDTDIRSSGNIPLHYANGYNYSKYKIGEDTIIEAYLHSKTDFLLGTVNSNVNYFIRALNKNIPYNILKQHDTN